MNNKIEELASTLEKCLLLRTCCTSIKDKAYLLGATVFNQDVLIVKFVKFSFGVGEIKNHTLLDNGQLDV